MKVTEYEKYTQAIWGLWGIIVLCAVMAIGCTAKRPYDKVDSDKTSLALKNIDKSLLDTKAEYLYVPSSLNSTRTNTTTFPMYMGEAKIVRLELAENALRVMEVDPEKQFEGNPVNNKPVLSIPITHVDYRCALDRDGKCTQKEEEDISKPWAKRRFVRINAEQLAVQEINFLPVEISNLFTGCHTVVGSSIENMSIEKDYINLGVEKTYKSGVDCAGGINDLSDLTFRVVYKYSLAKLDAVSTPNYKTITYSRREESTFGFFTSETHQLDRDNNATEDGKVTFLKRWAPRKKVVYYLSENFNEPQYAKIKATTVEAVASINNSLKLAGAELRIELKDAPDNLNPGDLRVNSIVMVEDPVNYGILGYGPTAANPRTGEIIHGRTAMYLGVMKTGIKRAYDELVKEKLAKKSSVETPTIQIPGIATLATTANRQLSALQARSAHNHRNHRTPVKPALDPEKILKTAQRLDERKLSLRDVAQLDDDAQIREQLLSLHCYYSLENFNVPGAIEGEIDQLIAEMGGKAWLQLSSEQKEKVVQTLLPFVWRPTLIHELGHNLGLRHNFAGSEDKANFYTERELQEMGVKRKFEYSSVMDYGYRSTNELQVMGKYDIAALRYAYTGQVELEKEEGQTEVKYATIEEFQKNPDLNIKPYRYCTDEHVDVNPGCKRFDEGTSITEIAEHWIRTYDENYLRRNFRNGAESFSLYDDVSYLRRLKLTFDSLRATFERYEDIKNSYGLTDENEVWEKIEFLKDLKTASQLAGKFFISVLQTPDTMCAIANTKAPNQILGLLPIQMISTNAISCFDQENLNLLDPAFVSVGQAGKAFQSRKDPHSTNPYMDQIDVRGIWIDKLLALQALTGRLTGIASFDEFTGNYLDLSDMRDDVQAALSALVLDEAFTPVTIRLANGRELTLGYPVKLYAKVPRLNGHRILKPLHPSLQKLFGIPAIGIDFQAKLVKTLKANLISPEQESDETSLLNSLQAFAGLPTGQTPDVYASTDIGLTRVFVHKKSKLALALLNNRVAVATLNQLTEEQLEKVKSDLTAGTAPAEDASGSELEAYKLGVDTIDKFLSGEFQDKSYYDMMLNALL